MEDLIISPDRTVSYLIIGAGGFIGIGRHDVAIPVTQVKDSGGTLVLPGATKAIVEAMPRFEYAASNRWRAFEGGVNAATTRLHKAVEALRG